MPEYLLIALGITVFVRDLFIDTAWKKRSASEMCRGILSCIGLQLKRYGKSTRRS